LFGALLVDASLSALFAYVADKMINGLLDLEKPISTVKTKVLTNQQKIDISNIAKKYGNLQCEGAAFEIQQYLNSNGISSQQVSIKFDGGKGYILSDTFGSTAISESGFHVGTMVNGVVYDNIHKMGIPYEQWVADFHGIGNRTITIK